MNKLWMVLLLSFGYMANTFAAQNPGYVYSAYGEVIRTAYGTCLHTAYFNSSEGLTECGEGPPPALAPVAPPPPTVVIETVTMSDADNVLFNFDAATLTGSGSAVLGEFIQKIGVESDVTKITINGYTDGIGKPEYNMKLSQDRASTVKQFFVSRGIPDDKIFATGMGMKEAVKSPGCFSQMGNDKQDQIWELQNKLKAKKYKASQKKSLQAQLNKLQTEQTQLIACTAPDRRVVFTIEHTEQVEKTITNDSSAVVQ